LPEQQDVAVTFRFEMVSKLHIVHVDNIALDQFRGEKMPDVKIKDYMSGGPRSGLRRVSIAGGSERGDSLQPAADVSLATARGTDPDEASLKSRSWRSGHIGVVSVTRRKSPQHTSKGFSIEKCRKEAKTCRRNFAFWEFCG